MFENRVTAHSGRVGLASELTSRSASTTDARWKLENIENGGALLRWGKRRNAVQSHATCRTSNSPTRESGRICLSTAVGLCRHVDDQPLS